MTRKFDTSTLPIQKLPMSKKTKEWREACVDYFVSKERSSTYFDNIKICYDLYNGVYDENDLQYVTNPFKIKEGFPASPHNFNIIKPKVDLLLGELTKRPDSFRVFHTGEEAVSKIQEEMIQSLKDYIYNKIGEGFDNLEEDQKIQEIQEFFKGSYTDEAEEAGYHTLNYLKERLDLSNEQFKAFKDGLISGIEVYYKGIINGEPYAERVNPYYFTADEDPDLSQTEKGSYAILRSPMSLYEIHHRLGDLMPESDFEDLAREAYKGGSSINSKASDVNYKPIWRNSPSWMVGENALPEYMFNVWHVTWRSFKKIGFLTTLDENGTPSTSLVDETYIPTENETIEWEWWNEIWEGYKIEDKLYVGIQPTEDQIFSVENPNGNDLPYIGSYYNNDNTVNKSMVEIMKPLQYMYIIIWYRLELALARDKGKAFVMDITQIPKNSGLDMTTWLHYLTALGIAFINPYEESPDAPGREAGRASSYNNFNAVDLSMANVISGYIEIMAKIEDMIGELSGVSKQRQGSIQQRELVGNVERSVIQSSHITEHLFWTHSSIIKRLYNALLNTAKTAWSRSGKSKLYYIMDDSNRAFIDLNESFFYSDMGVFVTDSTRESINIEKLATLLQPAMQNGATLLDAATILTTNNMSIIKNKLRDIEGKRMQTMQQQVQAEQQAAQADLQLKQDQIRVQEEDSIRQADTSVTVAQIKAYSEVGDAEEGGPDMETIKLNTEKLNLDREKFVKEFSLKQGQQREEIRKNKVAEEQRQQEIAIKKKQVNKPVVKSK
jgi:hypothetical protein